MQLDIKPLYLSQQIKLKPMTKEEILASSDKKKDKILKLAEIGESKKDIAAAVGCSLVYVYVTINKSKKVPDGL